MIKSLDDDKLITEVVETKNSLSTDRLDMSFGEIMSMYERNEIIIDPDFQRLFRWTPAQQTRFIESLLLGIPIPPIFVAEDQNGRWEVVDGLQRISTVLSFFGILKSDPISSIPDKNNWTLLEGELIQHLKGYNRSNLPLKLNLNLKRAICRIEIVKWNSKMDMRYELFNRLNTGGSPLTEQEIRNCIFRGTSSEFNKFLTKTASNPTFIDLVKPTERQTEQKYLEELILRFTSLLDNEWDKPENWERTTDKLSAYMTLFMKRTVNNPSYDFARIETLFSRVMALLSSFDYKIFRGSNFNFSTSLWDGITIGIASNIDYYECEGRPLINAKIIELIDDKEFIKSMGAGSSNKDRVINRVKASLRVFSNHE